MMDGQPGAGQLHTQPSPHLLPASPGNRASPLLRGATLRPSKGRAGRHRLPGGANSLHFHGSKAERQGRV